jgi:hypothetical protein
MMGSRAKGGEGETEREQVGEGERQRWWRERMAWVIGEDGVDSFDRWSKSTPGYFWRRQSTEK